MEVVQTDKYIPLTNSTITQKQQIANLKSYVKANLDKTTITGLIKIGSFPWLFLFTFSVIGFYTLIKFV